jgi:hypothetical protein
MSVDSSSGEGDVAAGRRGRRTFPTDMGQRVKNTKIPFTLFLELISGPQNFGSGPQF